MKLSKKEQKRLKIKYGEWAIVTGASSGIGFELASLLAEAGFHLIINARDEQRLQQAENLLTRNNVLIKSVIADVAETDGLKKIIQAAEGLDVGLLINNAGYGAAGWFVESSLPEAINMLRVNCEAVLSLTHFFARKFQQQHRGGIIFLSSLVAFQGVPLAANYAATKAYIQSFAEALAQELKPFKVDVLAAAPGPVDSRFGQRANMNMGKAILPDKIGAPILTALGRKTNVVPGSLSKILLYSLRILPRVIKIKIMQQVMRGFTKHQRFNDAFG
ncbi:MAG TPA: SDR family NAD(P)-dependent oxidoreductase [Chitinophagaceae bacterium]|nr:SDR family NAD(P)-dependent oxidoreductase [Chitinophagaceae bacterium]